MRFAPTFDARMGRRRAMTLTEILAVIAMILMLSALSFYGFQAASDYAERYRRELQMAANSLHHGPDARRVPRLSHPGLPLGPRQPNTPYPLGRIPKAPRPGGLAQNKMHGSFAASTVIDLHDKQRAALPFLPTAALASAIPTEDLVRSAYLSSRINDAEAVPQGDFVTAPAGNDIIWQTYPSNMAFKLHSNPGATKVIFMDFDGHVTNAGNPWNALVNGGNPITALAWSIDGNRGNFSTQEQDKIIQLWRMVAEDFMPFDVDVTTEDPGVAALTYSGAGDNTWGMRVVIGPQPNVSNPGPWAGAGGIAFVGSFKNAQDIVCWAWNGDLDPTAETSLPVTVSHEVGHTLGLSHDSLSGYYGGHGAGVTSWGPIMGAPFGLNLTQWCQGVVGGVAQYPGADNPEDDVTIIAGPANGFGYRPDDHGNTPGTATALNMAGQASLTTTYGIIEKATDVDYFSFVCDAGAINIQVVPLFTGPNLDVKADLYDAGNNLILSVNPPNKIDAIIATNLGAGGTYYLKISGTGLAPQLPAGYSNYGSIGSYKISGTVIPAPYAASTFRALNPIRWGQNPFTGTYSGDITIANVSRNTINGNFTFTLTFPDAGIVVVNPTGVQTGINYDLTFNGAMVPGSPLVFPLEITNPNRVPLATGLNTFVTQIKSN